MSKNEEKWNCSAECRHAINFFKRPHNYVACKTDGHSQDRLRPDNSLFPDHIVKKIGFQLKFQKLPVCTARWQHTQTRWNNRLKAKQSSSLTSSNLKVRTGDIFSSLPWQHGRKPVEDLDMEERLQQCSRVSGKPVELSPEIFISKTDGILFNKIKLDA